MVGQRHSKGRAKALTCPRHRQDGEVGARHQHGRLPKHAGQRHERREQALAARRGTDDASYGIRAAAEVIGARCDPDDRYPATGEDARCLEASDAVEADDDRRR